MSPTRNEDTTVKLNRAIVPLTKITTHNYNREKRLPNV
jgi:hypothetical protein